MHARTRLPALRLAALALAALLGSCSADTITQKLLIGTKCTSSDECGSQPWFVCDSNHPDGYCTKSCKSDADCPPESICAFDGGDGLCHARCDLAASCRAPKYYCHAASNDPANFASAKFCEALSTDTDAGMSPMDAAKSDAGGGAGG